MRRPESSGSRAGYDDGRGYDEPYFVTADDEAEGDEGTREDSVRLDQVLCDAGDRLTKPYDFGDSLGTWGRGGVGYSADGDQP